MIDYSENNSLDYQDNINLSEEYINVEQSTYQQPAYQQPAYQQPAYQQPTYQQPTYQQPTYQQPTYQQPTYQQPMYQQPTYQQPTYQQPTYQQPTYQQPMYRQPIYQQQVSHDMGYGEENTARISLKYGKINLWSVISAILILVAMLSSEFLHCVDWGDWSKGFSLSDFCSQISRGAKYCDGGHKIIAYFSGCMFYLALATFILCIVGEFIDVVIVKLIVTVVSAMCILVIAIALYNDAIRIGDETSLGIGYYILVAGIIVSVISVCTVNSSK